MTERVPEGTGLSQAEPVARLAPSGFDPSREGLSDGALRALLRHTRRDEDGGLFASVLGESEAEELWFCSMLRVANGKPALIRRTSWTSGLSGNTTWTYFLTEAGKRIHAIAMEARQGRDGETRLNPKDDSAGPKDIAQPSPDGHPHE